MKLRTLSAAVVASLLAASATAQVAEVPQWIFRMGIHPFQPKENSHTVIHLDDTAAATFGATYLFDKHWGIEMFGATPMTHEMRLRDGTKVAEARELPTTISVQYHVLDTTQRARAYAGVGIVLGAFAKEKTMGPFGGQKLDLHESTGLTALVGLDLDLGHDWFINA
ncbi:MAG TPA: OmpW family outer membrane protein, partial [Steroidobacteraceae bacterium]|nr:OmpW family outer membrane protein [Steroidobacteraceae bacterium]